MFEVQTASRATTASESQRAQLRLVGVLIAFLVLVGGVLRFVNLDGKVYWHDEAYTSLRAFGYTAAGYYAAAFDGKIHSPQELQRYQHPNPDQGWKATFSALATHPEHGPLYYVLGRLWAKAFADPVMAFRSLSAVISLLLLPAVYWLARNLFDARSIAWCAVLLVALSPFDLLYAQEARQYALWGVVTAFSSAALLHALAHGRRRDWGWYGLSVLLGFYTHLMYAFTVLAHGAYLLANRELRNLPCLRSWSAAVGLGVLPFLPWLFLFFTGLEKVEKVTGWMRQPASAVQLLEAWGLHVNRLFFDFPGSQVAVPASVLLVGLALYRLVRRTPRRVWSFPVLLLVITAGAVMLPDLLSGGRRSLEMRYLVPGLLVLQLTVAYLLGSMIEGARARWLVTAGALVLVSGALVSDVAIVRADTWWNKLVGYHNPEVAQIVNAAPRPLVITTLGDINPGEILSLSYLFDDRVRLLLLGGGPLPELPKGYSDIFVLNPAWDVKEALERRYRLVLIHPVEGLWRLYRDREAAGRATAAP